MKNVVNKNKVKKVHSKFRLHDGTLTEHKMMISDQFSEFFYINIGPNLAKKIPQIVIYLLHYMGSPEPHNIFLYPMTAIEFNNEIEILENGASGYDEISTSTLTSTCVSM